MAYSSADEDVLAEAAAAGSTTVVSKNEASFKEILQHFNELLEASRQWQIYNPANFESEAKRAEAPKFDRVLIVEDDFLTARLISDIAEKEDLKPVIVADGREAYKILASEANFAAAVLDIELPKIKGTDLLKYMRSEKRLRQIPVLMMTASTDYVKMQLESYHSGATFFISKPFERTIFQPLLKAMARA
jgi:CheY-like chemotaxis protein